MPSLGRRASAWFGSWEWRIGSVMLFGASAWGIGVWYALAFYGLFYMLLWWVFDYRDIRLLKRWQAYSGVERERLERELMAALEQTKRGEEGMFNSSSQAASTVTNIMAELIGLGMTPQEAVGKLHEAGFTPVEMHGFLPGSDEV